MAKKQKKVKEQKGFVDFVGRQADVVPPLRPKLAGVMRAAVMQTSGIDFGDLEILQTVEAQKDGLPVLFVEMQQVGTTDPITFCIPIRELVNTLGRGFYLPSIARTVRHYRASRKYTILPVAKPVEPTQLYFEPPKETRLETTEKHYVPVTSSADAVEAAK